MRNISERLFHGLIVIVLISIVTFVIMRLLPGDPVFLLMGSGLAQITDEQIEAMHQKWGLDQPWHIQYLTWMKNMLTGDFGESLIRPGVPVRDIILEAVPVTFRLNLYALIIAVLVSIPAGVLGALKRISVFDYGATIASTLGVALPNFWIGLMLIVLFSRVLDWLPPFGLRSWKGMIMPVIVMAFGQTAVIMRVMRGSLIEQLEADYVRTARAKGLTSRAVLLRHAARNALLPVVTVIGFQFAFILSGTIVVETVFALPGIGRLLTDSVINLDYQVVQSIVFVFSVLVIVANTVTDLTYTMIDPRIRIN